MSLVACTTESAGASGWLAYREAWKLRDAGAETNAAVRDPALGLSPAPQTAMDAGTGVDAAPHPFASRGARPTGMSRRDSDTCVRPTARRSTPACTPNVGALTAHRTRTARSAPTCEAGPGFAR